MGLFATLFGPTTIDHLDAADIRTLADAFCHGYRICGDIRNNYTFDAAGWIDRVGTPPRWALNRAGWAVARQCAEKLGRDTSKAKSFEEALV